MKKLTFILFTLLVNYSFAQKSRTISSPNLKEKSIPKVKMSDNVATFNPKGYEIQIFENDNFSGYNANLDGYWQEGTNMQRWSNKDFAQLKTIEGDDYHMNYNDKISSIQIYNQR